MLTLSLRVLIPWICCHIDTHIPGPCPSTNHFSLSSSFPNLYSFNCPSFHACSSVRGTPYKLLRTFAHTCEHLRTAAPVSAKGALAQTRRTLRKQGAPCANKAHLAQTRRTLCQPSPNLPIPTHGLIWTPITTHGLMRTPSLIDGKPPWMGTRPWM